MKVRSRIGGLLLLAMVVCIGETGCRLHRPKTTPSRMIDPQVVEPSPSGSNAVATKAANVVSLRLLDTQAASEIGRHVLHREGNGELIEDAVWRWSSSPDRYLDAVLRQELVSNPAVQLVDSAKNPALGATLVVWNLESGEQTRLVGAVEFQLIATDRVVQTKVINGSEAVSLPLPGDLAEASGRLLKRLASEGVKFVSSQSGSNEAQR